MKPKLLWSTVVVLGLMLILAHAQTPAQSQSVTGRYQLIVAPASSDESVQVFRLDTTTGKAWVKVLVGDSKNIAWALIPEVSALKSPR
jgi:hypothetical protein